MSLGEYVAFNGYLGMLTWPLMAIRVCRESVSARRCGAVATRRNPGYTDLTEVQRSATGERSDSVFGVIEFRHLTFAYGQSSAPVLKDISLTIPPGKKCGIIGELGSGKTPWFTFCFDFSSRRRGPSGSTALT